MTWTAQGGNSAGSKVLGGTSFTIGSPGVAQAGDVIIVKVALNNTSTVDADTSPVTSITDALGNTYTALRSRTNANAAAGAGASVAIWACLNSLAGTVGTITINHGALDARGGIAEIFRPTNGNGGSVDATTAINQADAQDPVSFSLTPSGGNVEYLWLYALAAEGPSTDTDTADAANGWTGSGVAGTTGGSAVTNMTVGGGYQIATASSKTCNWVHTASDYVQALVAITENAAAGAGIAALVAADPNYNGGPRMAGFFESDEDDDRDYDYQYHSLSTVDVAPLFASAPAFTRSNTAQGGTDGLVPTTGNTGGASGDAFDVVNADGTDSRLRFKTFDSADGGIGYRFVSGSGTIQLQWDASTNPTQLWTRYYLWLGKWPTTTVTHLLLQDDVGGGDNLVGITSAGLLRATTHAGFTSDGAVAIPQEQWVRIETRVLSDNVASGQLEVRLWLNPNSAGAADDTILMTGRQTGNFTDFVSWRSSDGAVVVQDFVVDDLAVSDVTWIGPAAGTFATGDAPLSSIANVHPTGAEHAGAFFDWRPDDAFQAAIDASVQTSTDVVAAFNPPAAPGGNTDEELQAIHQQTDPFAGIVWPEPDSTHAAQQAIATSVDVVGPWRSKRMVLDLDASNMGALSDLDPVNVWPDLAEGHDFATNGTNGLPTYRSAGKWSPFGRPTVSFVDGAPNDQLDGGNLSSIWPEAVTFFAVFRPINDPNTRYSIFMNTPNDEWWSFGSESYMGPFRTSRVATFPPNGTIRNDEGYYVVAVVSSAAVYDVWVNGTKYSSTPAYDKGDRAQLGSTDPDQAAQDRGLTGYISQIRAYNWELSDLEVQAVYAELNPKWLDDPTPTIYPSGSELPVFDYAPIDFEAQQAAIATSMDVTAAFNPPAGAAAPTDGEIAAITQLPENLDVFGARELQDEAGFQAALDAATQTSASTAGHTAMHTHWPPIEWVRNGGGEWYRLDGWDDGGAPGVTLVSDGTAHSGDVYFEVTGSGQTGLPDDVFPIVDPLGVTTISGWFRYPGTGNVPLYYLGFYPLDRNGQSIEAASVYFGPFEEYTTLTADLIWGDTTIQVADPTIFSATAGRGGNPAIVFNPDTSGAYDDLPNKELFYVTPGSSPLAILYAPAQRAGYGPGQVLWPAGTVVRRHEAAGSFIYAGAAGVFATSSWALATGTVSGIATPFEAPDLHKWRIGTVLVRVIILANYQGTLSTTQWDDISVVQPEQSETFLVGQQGALTGRDVIFGDTIALFVQTGGDAKLTHDNQRSVGGRAARFYSGSGFSGSNYASLEGYQYLVPGTDGSLLSDPDQTRLWTRFDFAANQRPPSYLPIWSWNGAGGAAFVELRSDGTLAICNGDDGSVVAGGSVPTNLFDFARVEIKAEKRTATTLAVDLALYLDETSAVPDETLSGVARSNALGIDLAASRIAIGPTPQRHGGGTDPGFAMWIDELAYSTRGMPATPTRAQATTAAPSDVVASGPFDPRWPHDAWQPFDYEAIDASVQTSIDVTAAFNPPAAGNTDAELQAAAQQTDPFAGIAFDFSPFGNGYESYLSDSAAHIVAGREVSDSDSLAVAISDTATVAAFESIEGLIAADQNSTGSPNVAGAFDWSPDFRAELDPASSVDVAWYLADQGATDVELQAAAQTHENLGAFSRESFAPFDYGYESYLGDLSPQLVADASQAATDSLAVGITDSASVQAFEGIEQLLAADPNYSGSTNVAGSFDWAPDWRPELDPAIATDVAWYLRDTTTDEELSAASQMHENLEAFYRQPETSFEDYAGSALDPAPFLLASVFVVDSDPLAVAISDTASVQAFASDDQLSATVHPTGAEHVGAFYEWGLYDVAALDPAGSTDVAWFLADTTTDAEYQAAALTYDSIDAHLRPPETTVEDFGLLSSHDPAPSILADRNFADADSLAIAISDTAAVQAFESIEGLIAADPGYGNGLGVVETWEQPRTTIESDGESSLDVSAVLSTFQGTAPPEQIVASDGNPIGLVEALRAPETTWEDWAQVPTDPAPTIVATASVWDSDSLGVGITDTATVEQYQGIVELLAAQPTDPQGLAFPLEQPPFSVDVVESSSDLSGYVSTTIATDDLAPSFYPESGTVEALRPPETTTEDFGLLSSHDVTAVAVPSFADSDSVAIAIDDSASVQAFSGIAELLAAQPTYGSPAGTVETWAPEQLAIADYANVSPIDVADVFATVSSPATEQLAVGIDDSASVVAFVGITELVAAQPYGNPLGLVEPWTPPEPQTWESPSALDVVSALFPPARFSPPRIAVGAVTGRDVALSGVEDRGPGLSGVVGAGTDLDAVAGRSAAGTGAAGRTLPVVPQSPRDFNDDFSEDFD